MLVSKHNCELALRGAWVRHYQGILPEIPGRNLALTVLYYQMCLTWVGADLQRGSSTCVSLNSRLEINKGEEDDLQRGPGPPRHCHDARPVDLIITMIKWIRTSRLATKNSLSRWVGADLQRGPAHPRHPQTKGATSASPPSPSPAV